jgi:hypothetical protein
MLDTSIAYLLDPEPIETAAGAAGARDFADERVYFDVYSEAVADVVESIGPAVVRVDTRERGGKPGRGGVGGVGSGVVSCWFTSTGYAIISA